LFLSTLSLLSAGGAARAAQSYDNCTGFITSVPAVISTQGTWCLKQDLATAIASGNAISVNANNVTLDCNDFKLGGLAAGAGTLAYGIAATSRANVTVRHCNIRGFLIGLFFSGAGSSGHAIEDNRFDGNTYSGIFVGADGSVIRRNRVFDTGLTTQSIDASGIVAFGTIDVLENSVSGVVARSGGGGSAYGIGTSGSVGGRIIGNGVRGLVKDGAGTINGIANSGSDHVTLRDNDVLGDASAGSTGLACSDSFSSARDNTVSRFANSIVGCSSDGGNVLHP
jgi:parallel beta-helix repeat protein